MVLILLKDICASPLYVKLEGVYAVHLVDFSVSLEEEYLGKFPLVAHNGQLCVDL